MPTKRPEGGAGKRLLLKFPVAPDWRPSRRRARRRRETLIEGVVALLLVLEGDLEGIPLRRRAEGGAAGVGATGKVRVSVVFPAVVKAELTRRRGFYSLRRGRRD